MNRALPALAALIVVAAACATAAPHTNTRKEATMMARIGVLPVQWLSEPPVDAPDLTAAAARAVASPSAPPNTDNAKLASLLQAQGAACIEELSCLQRVGVAAAVDKLVVVRAASLGRTVVVRATLVDIARSAEESTRQAVVQAPGQGALDRDTAALVRELIAPLRPPPAPVDDGAWWWVAGASGAALLVSGVALAFLWPPSDEATPDVVIQPP